MPMIRGPSLCRFVDADPSWAKQLEGEMTRGKHVITFSAHSPLSSQVSSCQMIIHVRDMEPPRVRQCPQSFAEYLPVGQRSKRITWKEPIFQDNVQIQHVMASFLPGHYFSEGRHHVLYQATDMDGNIRRCGFTITVLPPQSSEILHGNNGVSAACENVPEIPNGHMSCEKIHLYKRCTPVCDPGHEFYQQFTSRPPTYLCNEHRIDWELRRFIPDCSPVYESPICAPGWEERSAGRCVACPPGMKRSEQDLLCQLCPKGSFAMSFHSEECTPCPRRHTTRGLGSRRPTQCYYRRQSLVGGSHQGRKGNRLGFLFLYNRWMSAAEAARDSAKDGY